MILVETVWYNGRGLDLKPKWGNSSLMKNLFPQLLGVLLAGNLQLSPLSGIASESHISLWCRGNRIATVNVERPYGETTKRATFEDPHSVLTPDVWIFPAQALHVWVKPLKWPQPQPSSDCNRWETTWETTNKDLLSLVNPQVSKINECNYCKPLF